MFVDEPVVKPAEEYQIVKVGGSSLGPVDNVMDLQPVVVSTSVELALPSVTVMDQTT